MGSYLGDLLEGDLGVVFPNLQLTLLLVVEVAVVRVRVPVQAAEETSASTSET